MHDKEYLLDLLDYNVWANEKYFNQVRYLSLDEVTKQCQTLVKNILISPNRLLVIDQVWLAYKKAKTRLFGILQTVLHEDLDDLFAAKRKMDKKVYNYVSGLGDHELEGVIRLRAYRRDHRLSVALHDHHPPRHSRRLLPGGYRCHV